MVIYNNGLHLAEIESALYRKLFRMCLIIALKRFNSEIYQERRLQRVYIYIVIQNIWQQT